MFKKSLKIVFVCLLFPCLSLFAQEGDSLSYQGYRINVYQVDILKKKSSYIKLDCKVYNTGREDIVLNSDAPEHLVVNFDEDFKASKDGKAYIPYIKQALLRSGRSVEVGGSFTFDNYKVKFPKGAIAKEEKAFEVTVGQSEDEFGQGRCSDLKIDSIYVIKKTKRYLTVGYVLKNYGNGAVSLEGTSSPYDNVGIEAYFTGAPKLGRGALVSGRFYITKALKESNGVLFPNQKYEGTLKISLSKKTRYTASLILFVDAQGVIIECDETNNTSYIIVP